MSGRPDSPVPVEVVDGIAEAAQACPAVAGLHGGRFGQHTTYLPGRRVAGVTVSPEEILVGVVGCYPAGVAEIASQVRAAVGTLVPGAPVTVVVEDLQLPGERLPGDTRDPAADDPAGGGPGRPASAQSEPVLPGPVSAPVPGMGPVVTRPPSAPPPAPPEKERFS